MAFLDLSKLFDAVMQRIILLRKSNDYGIRECALKLRKNHLNNTLQSYLLNGTKSDYLQLNIGVLHGTILDVFILRSAIEILCQEVEPKTNTYLKVVIT